MAFVTTNELTCETIRRFNALKMSPYILEVFPTLAAARNWIAQQLPLQDMQRWMQDLATRRTA